MSHKGKKVLFLCSWYPNRKNPTLGNFVQKHAEAASLLNEVVVLAIVADETIHSIEIVENRRGEMHEILIYYPKKKKSFTLFGSIQAFAQYKKAFSLGMKRVYEVHGKPNLIHLNVIYPLGYFARKLKTKLGIPLVISEHASGFQGGENAYPKVILSLAKKVLKSSACVMPVSQDLGERLKKLAPSITVQVVPNVVNEAIFLPSETPQTAHQFVHISTAFEPAKNVLGILRAVHQLSKVSSNFSFHIISDGDVTKAHQLARELGVLNSFVFFYPTMSTVEIANFVKKCRAMVLFSNFENFPCVIPEAWMCGVPVIATAVNGIPEFANDSNSILVEPRNEAQLVEAMQAMMNGKSFDPEELRNYALKNFSYAAVGKQLDEVYNSLSNNAI
jgi:glycosyltransferase involved in cell wall biosynthesis